MGARQVSVDSHQADDSRSEINGIYSGSDLDAVTLHELFNVPGFVHFDDYDFFARFQGVPTSVPLTWVNRPDAEAVLWTDIDLLRRIFPQGG